MHKIAFCTSIKNRLSHFKRTFPQNLDLNKTALFIILDYGSDDKLFDYIKPYISDRVKYYRYDSRYFIHPHARNMSFRLAYSDIVVNLDADNYTGVDFDKWCLDNIGDNKYLRSCYGNGGSYGRLGIYYTDFLKTRGYNEELIYGWGLEDIDYYERLDYFGYNAVCIPEKYLGVIKHSNFLRTRNTRSSYIKVSNDKHVDIMNNSNPDEINKSGFGRGIVKTETGQSLTV